MTSSSSDHQKTNNGNKISESFENPFYSHTSTDCGISSQDLLECSPERQGNPSWYSDQGRGRDWHNHNYRDTTSQSKDIDDDSFSKTFINSPLSDNAQQDFSRSFSVESGQRPSFENYKYFNNSADSWRDSHRHESSVNGSVFQPLPNGNSSGLFNNSMYSLNEDRFSFRTLNNNFSFGQPLYTPNAYHLQNRTLPNIGLSSIKDSAQFNDVYANSIPKFQMPSNTGGRSDQNTNRKHGTSFNHEQPTPYYNKFKNSYQNSIYKMDEENSSINYVNMTVTLQRQESGFGFRIIGGTEEGSQVSLIFFLSNFYFKIYAIVDNLMK